MAVKVDDGDRPVGAVDGPQQGEGDGVVAAEGDDARERLALDGRAALVGVGRRGAGEDAVVAVFDLLERPGVVVTWWGLVGGWWGEVGLGGSYEVTGMSPQSSTVAQLLKGFVLRGTLYPPLN